MLPVSGMMLFGDNEKRYSLRQRRRHQQTEDDGVSSHRRTSYDSKTRHITVFPAPQTVVSLSLPITLAKTGINSAVRVCFHSFGTT